jgi:hypothetical protein
MARLVSDAVQVGDGAPEKYVVEVDGVSVDAAPEDNGNGTVRLNYDLGAITPGGHTINVTAINKWGASEVVNFTFAATPPAPPSNLRLEF